MYLICHSKTFILLLSFSKAHSCYFVGLEYRVFMDRFGEEFFCLCFEFYGEILGALGGTLVDFFCNIDGVYQHVSSERKVESVSSFIILSSVLCK